jgi:hypothetical protein
VSEVRIGFKKSSDQRFVLEIERDDGSNEELEAETSSELVQGFLRYSVESETGFESGFWGGLAAGRTIAEMNDRTGKGRTLPARAALIELVVGALHGTVKGQSAEELVDAVKEYSAVLRVPPPRWLTVEFVAAVKGRMRRLAGDWKATPVGGALELEWPCKNP